MASDSSTTAQRGGRSARDKKQHDEDEVPVVTPKALSGPPAPKPKAEKLGTSNAGVPDQLVEHFQSISSLPGYTGQSFEEIRISDYAKDRGKPPTRLSSAIPFPTTASSAIHLKTTTTHSDKDKNISSAVVPKRFPFKDDFSAAAWLDTMFTFTNPQKSSVAPKLATGCTSKATQSIPSAPPAVTSDLPVSADTPTPSASTKSPRKPKDHQQAESSMPSARAPDRMILCLPAPLAAISDLTTPSVRAHGAGPPTSVDPEHKLDFSNPEQPQPGRPSLREVEVLTPVARPSLLPPVDVQSVRRVPTTKSSPIVPSTPTSTPKPRTAPHRMRPVPVSASGAEPAVSPLAAEDAPSRVDSASPAKYVIPRRRDTESQSPPGVRRRYETAPAFGASILKVSVGAHPDTQTFRIHKTLTRQQSGLVEAACIKGCEEGEEKLVRLPAHDPEHFELFTLFIYSRTVFSMKADDRADGTVDLEWVRLVQAWALGDHMQATDFKDAVTDAILQKVDASRRGIPPMFHRIVFMHTKPASLLRRLIIDIAVWSWNTDLLKAQRVDGAWRGCEAWADFFMDLAVTLNEVKKTGLIGKPPFEEDSCAYHEHRITKTPCYKTKSGGSRA